MKPGSEVTSRAWARIAAIVCAVIASTGATTGSRADAEATDRAQAIVSVQTVPLGATVLLDGQPIGTTNGAASVSRLTAAGPGNPLAIPTDAGNLGSTSPVNPPCDVPLTSASPTAIFEPQP